MVNSDQLKKNIIYFATDTLGLDDCRFTTPECSKALEHYKDWLNKGYYGQMEYLKKHLPFKGNANLLLEDVRSAIVLVKNYKNTNARRLKGPLKISRYAVGKDYHEVMFDRLQELENFIKSKNAKIKCYSGVDSRPIAERSLALKSGIGFLGKNTMVIKPGLGSFLFIGVILTTHNFKEDRAIKKDCGKCRLCIDACPTNAITEPYNLDATRCISYKTIERKTPLTKIEASSSRGWIFGCDICQEVCPHNNASVPVTNWAEFLPAAGVGFDFFNRNPKSIGPEEIPKSSVLARSRKRLIPNWQAVHKITSR